MAEGEGDDDFEDLFSFGVTTPGAPSEEPKTQPTSVGSDFDILLSDVSLSTPTTPGVASAPAPGGARAAGAPPLSAGASSVRTPRSAGAGDDFDALFGTPPIATGTPAGRTSTETDSLLPIDEPPNATDDQMQPQHGNLSIDDFHVHDEDTRDMLEWLDDDVTGRKSHDDSSKDMASNVSGDAADVIPGSNATKAEDDDFDFDQMLAQSESTGNESIKDSKQSATEGKGAEPMEDDTGDEPGDSDDTIPVPVSKRQASACIEEELAFDQWEDENEEMEDLTPTDEQDISENVDGEGETLMQKDGEAAKAKPPSKKNITFSSLSDAIRSNASAIDDVRSLFFRERGFHEANDDVGVSKDDRAHLWTKVICGKIVENIEDGSLADSYREWEKKGEVPAKFEGKEYGAVIDSLLKQCGLSDEDDTYENTKQQLLSLSYFQSRNYSSTPSSLGIDPLIPPVALAVLRAGIPPAAASVVLSHIEPSAMPLLRLSHDERYLAAKALHSQFYLLACYHLPLLVMQLDRHCPGWYWPRREKMGHQEIEKTEDNRDATADDDKKEEREKNCNGDNAKDEANDEKADDIQSGAGSNSQNKKESNLEQNGLIPLSYFVTMFAGSSPGSCLDHKNLLQLWDHMLTKADHSWKYFLAIAILEKNSDVLLMSRGEELKKELQKILDFQETSFDLESFVGASEVNTSGTKDAMTAEWLLSAKALIESTPSSAIELLRSADDRAVASALKVRQTKMDEELQAQLDADALARKKERDLRDKDSERALNKARLTTYYRTYNPEKMDTIDQILKVFDGRIEVLNEKLKKKYGEGFLPDQALKDQTRGFLLSVNQSITDTRKHVSVAVAERRKKKPKAMPESRAHIPVVLEVSTTEIIPVICTTKGHNLATGEKMNPSRRTSDTDSALQFYLIDCRPESIASEQGRFPTAVSLSPEKLQDPDELQKLTDMFESLRSAVHICVMGEGFASFPVLYKHSLSKAEEKLLEDDIARTSNCALFFLKKGFPFVSILRGGFAAAHAFLSREGPPMDMGPTDVLVEYDPDVSLFAQLETARQEEDKMKNAPAREKTARTLQKIIDNSMTRLTLEEQRINNLANDLAKPETVDKMKQSVSNFLAKPKTVPSITFGRTPPLFMSKKFASTKQGGKSEDKIESTQEENKGKPSASLVEKINFKLPSLHSESSTVLSDEDDAVGGKGNSTEGNVEDCTTSNPKVSSAFTSLTQRMQQAKTIAAINPSADSGWPTDEVESSKKESTVGKLSFSSFANKIKFGQHPAGQQPNPSDQETDNKGSEEKKNSTPENISAATLPPNKEEQDEGNAISKPSKVSSAFASLSQRMHQSTATTVSPTSESGQLTTEVDQAKKEGTRGMSFFTNRIKLSQQSADQLSNPPNQAVEGTGTEDNDEVISEKTEVSPKVIAPTNNPAAARRFSNFTKSVGGGLSGLRDRAVEAKVSYEKKSSNLDANEKYKAMLAASKGAAAKGEEVKEDAAKESEPKEKDEKTTDATDNQADGGRFSKFTKSIGGSMSGIRNQPRFGSLMHTKPESADIKQGSDTEEPDMVKKFTSFGKLLLKDEPMPNTRFQRDTQPNSADPKKSSEVEESDMTKALSSLGKLLLEDEPLPKTRFQRMESEELISFDAETDEAKASNTDSQGGIKSDSTEDLFADVSLTEEDEEKPANSTKAKADE